MGKTSAAQVKEEAAGWLVRLDSGSADVASFAAWRDADARHAAAFAHVAHSWNELGRLRLLREAAPTSARASWVDRRSVMRLGGGALAAAVAGAVALPLVNEAHAETGPGERRSVVLPDRSRVHLNTRTAITWRRWGGTRILWLHRGEIELDVSRDEKPFTLVAGRAVSLGSGSFNARQDADVLALIPLHGHASIAHRVIAVGDMASISDNAATVVPLDASTRDDLVSWRRGEIVFDGVSLPTAVGEFNRYLERPLVVADPHLAHLRIGGRFQAGDPASFLEALTAGFGVRAVDRGVGPILLSAAQKKMPRR